VGLGFFKPIWNPRLQATAQVVKRTRTLGLIECEVTDETGGLVAKVYSSCIVVRGQALGVADHSQL
jgi:acyl-coenzyme A thioesterase PaaI-like protein